MKSSVKQNYFGKERYPEEQERINECGKRLKEAIKEAGSDNICNSCWSK